MQRASAAFVIAIGLGAGLADTGKAGDGPVVIELFTAQGCVSCPPADAHLAEHLAARDDVIALALHVDYWDYIGWEDAFARPEFTARQKNYARANGNRTIYTPQMIVGGRDMVAGFRPMQLAERIAEHRARPDTVVLSARHMGDGMVEIVARRTDAALPDAMTVQLVRYTPRREVSITRGENAGRTIVYANIVTDWQQVDHWDGRADYTAQVPAPGDEPAAVIIQAEGPGPVIAAAMAR